MSIILSNEIEKFLLDNFGDDNFIDLSRNELAMFFNCVPSQINYVLTTRFSPKRGYRIESQRGGGGYVRVTKIEVNDKNKYQYFCEKIIGNSISYIDAKMLLKELLENKNIGDRDFCLLDNCISPNALSNPFKTENYIRANIMKNCLLNVFEREGNDE